MDFLSLILAIAVAVLWLYYFGKKQDAFEKHGIPLKKGIPVFGSSWRAVLHLQPFAEMVQDVYAASPDAKYVGFYHRMAPVVMLRDAELMKSVAIKNFDRFPNHRGFENSNVEPFLSKNLLLLRGGRWKEVRSLLSPAFTSSKLKAMFRLMSACAENVGRFLAELPESSGALEMKDVFTRYTNDAFASCAFGVELNSMLDRENRFYVLGRQALDIHRANFFKLVAMQLFPAISRMLDLRLIGREITDFFEQAVASSVRARDESGVGRPDLIQLMMEARGKLGEGKELSVEDMTAHAFSFFFGGFETISSLLCFAAYELALNPEVQRRLQAEIDLAPKDVDGGVSYDATIEMRYLDAVVNEVLRMYPVIPITDRQSSGAFELPPALPGLKPFLLEEGSHVWLPIYAIQRDPKYFEEPARFDPGRFLNAQSEIFGSGAYMPFGMGPRVCIASRLAILQTKVALICILARCEFTACTETPVPLKYRNAGTFLTADKGFWLQVLPRNSSAASDNA